MTDIQETCGVIYYNRGEKCLLRICVSIFSLRKVYSGAVCLLYEGALDPKVGRFLDKMNVERRQLTYRDDCRALVRKATTWRDTPYDRTLFLDADTIVLNPIDEMFEFLSTYDLVVTNFSGWKTSGRTIAGRIKGFSSVVSEEEIQAAIKYGNESNYGGAVNTGVYAFRKDAKILETWENLAYLGSVNHCSFIPDEIACQII